MTGRRKGLRSVPFEPHSLRAGGRGQVELRVNPLRLLAIEAAAGLRDAEPDQVDAEPVREPPRLSQRGLAVGAPVEPHAEPRRPRSLRLAPAARGDWRPDTAPGPAAALRCC